jgi:hypothetical protein
LTGSVLHFGLYDTVHRQLLSGGVKVVFTNDRAVVLSQKGPCFFLVLGPAITKDFD